LEDLERRERLNPREFASLYQQSPFIQGGNLIRSQWWRTYPSDMRPEQFTSLIIAADTAFKAKSTSDYSVMMTMGLDKSGDIYIVDVHRERYEFPDLKRKMIMLNNQWRGRGLRGIYIEDKASGQSLLQELKRESGVSVIPYKISTDKVTRLSAVLPLIEGGRVLLPDNAPWLDAFHDECQTFPAGTHDDQIDALSIGLDVLARTPQTGEYYRPPTFGKLNKEDSLFSQKSDLNQGTSWRNWGE
jgi:predicted phage terminase large subunit-like protein